MSQGPPSLRINLGTTDVLERGYELRIVILETPDMHSMSIQSVTSHKTKEYFVIFSFNHFCLDFFFVLLEKMHAIIFNLYRESNRIVSLKSKVESNRGFGVSQQP